MYRHGQSTHAATQPRHTAQHHPQPYVVEHDFDGAADLTTTLIHAVADVAGVDVTETGFTLNDHVDPDALDRLFAPKADGSPRANGHVCFDIWSHRVTVYGDGRIEIVPPRQATLPTPR